MMGLGGRLYTQALVYRRDTAPSALTMSQQKEKPRVGSWGCEPWLPDTPVYAVNTADMKAELQGLVSYCHGSFFAFQPGKSKGWNSSNECQEWWPSTQVSALFSHALLIFHQVKTRQKNKSVIKYMQSEYPESRTGRQDLHEASWHPPKQPSDLSDSVPLEMWPRSVDIMRPFRVKSVTDSSFTVGQDGQCQAQVERERQRDLDRDNIFLGSPRLSCLHDAPVKTGTDILCIFSEDGDA